jgi:hypothetical protein
VEQLACMHACFSILADLDVGQYNNIKRS